ncbi:MAG TPA: YidB family protein [Rhodanobacter sp.]|jgi:uncharacterized protein YidB (DUF937 family)|nr:YidB family protein [Rhodanobacter sp.]
MSLLGNLLGGEGQQASIIGVVGQLVQRAGGVQGVVSMLQQHGLGEAVQSWVGTGANQPVSGGQLGQALQGGGLGPLLQEAAGKLGINQDELLGKLSQVLPHAVDHVTPDGQVPPAGAVSGFDVAALEGLAGKLFG